MVLPPLLVAELYKKGYLLSVKTVDRYVKIMSGKVKHIHLKPSLSQEQRNNRMRFVLSQADGSQGRPFCKYKDQLNTIHVDESWLYLHKEDSKILAFANTIISNPETVQHKSHIKKVMFLIAMARPRKVNGRWFDGKIGLWPCITTEKAKRTSRNMPKGSDVVVCRNMDAEFYHEICTMHGGLLDTIKNRCHGYMESP